MRSTRFIIMTEKQWDKLLKIKTSGRDDSKSNTYNYPYEPTPYEVLERLAASGYITKSNTVLDYGCGKGRVEFYLTYQTKCKTIGIEYDERMYEKAVENQKDFGQSQRIQFVLENAVNYQVERSVDRIYFFNPFSVDILQKVMMQIMESYYENPREILLFFYYPSDEYINCLLNLDMLTLHDEINCQDIFGGNDVREQILVFKI